MKPRILVIDGHANPNSFCSAISNSYYQGAQESLFEVDKIALRDLNFDLNLRSGYSAIQDLEPDLILAQEKIKWCSHLVIIYPIWWGTMPALVKGFLDRCWLPGFAFKYHKNGPFWDRLLAGRSARMIVTSDAPTLYNFLMYFNAPVVVMKKAVLGFCGFKPVRVTTLGNIKSKSRVELEQILEKMKKLGSTGH